MENGRYQHFPYMVYTYDSVDSTNAVALRAIRMAGEGVDRSVHIAGEQTEGKGRSGRTWSNTDEAVMMSIVRQTKLTMDRIPMLNLAAAAAVRNAVRRLTGGEVDLTIKWPNDVLTQDRLEKVCGILSECVRIKNRNYAVIGIGLNLNAKKLPEGLLQPASSIRLQYGKYINVLEAVNCILDEFEIQYNSLITDPTAFLKEYARFCVSLGRHVTVNDGEKVRYGVGDGLSPNGQLIVRFEDGGTDVVYAADVSVRNLNVIDDTLALRLRPKRSADANKGAFGRAAMIVGSETMPGAALMSTMACIRSGAGLTRALIPPAIFPSFASIPEAMLLTDDARADELIEWASAIGVGCGMGVSERTYELVRKVLLSKKPCVIDADALNTIAQRRDLMKLLHENAVVTPHPAEMGRLIKRSTDHVLKSFSPAAIDFAERRGCTVLLKSSSSIIVSPEGEIRYNDRGSSALAKGGSGDVLTGVVTAMLAQGLKPFDAASVGSYLLGASGEEALDYLHNRFACAGDIIDIICEKTNGRSF